MLTRIDIENFRCIESASLELDARATGIIGANASGKTSLLEAIYFLGHGRSFRTQHRDRLLRSEADFFRIVGRLQPQAQASPTLPSIEPNQRDDLRALAPASVVSSVEHDTSDRSAGSVIQSAGSPLVVGIEYVDGATRAHLAGRGVSGIADIAEVLPVQIIDPGIHRLIEEGSARRRRLMDWGVFHVKHEFLGWWRRYQRALLQRNTALRGSNPMEMVVAWEREMAAAGTAVDQLRSAYLERLAPHFEAILPRLVHDEVRFTYRRGWSADQDLANALQESRLRDLRLKTTQVGPHRADVSFLVAGEPARDRVSRGQQKMLAAGFILSQLALRVAEQAPRACLMLDDPAAELDVDNLGKLLAVIADIPAQLIVTSVHEQGLQGIGIARMFHVEQGRFSKML